MNFTGDKDKLLVHLDTNITDLSNKLKINRSHLSKVLNNNTTCSRKLALKICNRGGLNLNEWFN